MFNRLEPPAHLPAMHQHCFMCCPAGEASDVLSDASKRRELDHALRAAAGGSGFGSRGGFSSYYGAPSSLCVLLVVLMVGVMVRLDCCLQSFRLEWAACTRRTRSQRTLWVMHALPLPCGQPHPCPSPDPHLPTLPKPETFCLQGTRMMMSATFTTPSTTCLEGGGRPAAAAAVLDPMAAVTLAPVLGSDPMVPMVPMVSAAAAVVAAPATGASSKPSARVARQERPLAAVRGAPHGSAAGAS